MGFNIKPNIERYDVIPLQKGYGIVELKTGEILKKKGHPHRIERYVFETWARKRCSELNKKGV